MFRVVVTLLIFLLSVRPARAVELLISDVLVVGTEITLTASLSATSDYYLQGTLRREGSSKYFGETQNNQGNWIDYTSAPDKELITSSFFKTNIVEASWSGQLAIKFYPDHADYQGPGNYELKLKRYTGNSSSSAGESNTLNIVLSEPLPSPSPSPVPSPTPMPSLSPSPTPTPDPSLAPSLSPTPSIQAIPSPALEATNSGSVAGAVIDLTAFSVPSPSMVLSSPPPASPQLNTARAMHIMLIGLGLILLSTSGWLFYRRRRL